MYLGVEDILLASRVFELRTGIRLGDDMRLMSTFILVKGSGSLRLRQQDAWLM